MELQKSLDISDSVCKTQKQTIQRMQHNLASQKQQLIESLEHDANTNTPCPQKMLVKRFKKKTELTESVKSGKIFWDHRVLGDCQNCNRLKVELAQSQKLLAESKIEVMQYKAKIEVKKQSKFQQTENCLLHKHVDTFGKKTAADLKVTEMAESYHAINSVTPSITPTRQCEKVETKPCNEARIVENSATHKVSPNSQERLATSSCNSHTNIDSKGQKKCFTEKKNVATAQKYSLTQLGTTCGSRVSVYSAFDLLHEPHVIGAFSNFLLAGFSKKRDKCNSKTKLVGSVLKIIVNI